MSEEANKQIKDNIAKFYDLVMEKPRKVYEIFCDFFGEERVDLQNCISLEDTAEQIKFEMRVDRLFTPEQIESIGLDINEFTLNSLDEEVAIRLTSLLDKCNIDCFMSRIVNYPYILVHFPKVTVTNEFDKSVDITHLWAKVPINYSGIFLGINFTLNRSEYTYIQYISDYMHSHIRCIPKDNFQRFEEPCLGSGPIKQTIRTLNIAYNEEIWNLFCLELNKYVSVESIAGVPYKRLEEIGTRNSHPIGTELAYNRDIHNSVSDHNIPLVRDFITHYLRTYNLKFSFDGYKYSLGMSSYDFIIHISNAFIKWYNSTPNIQREFPVSTLYANYLILDAIIKNRRIYTTGERNSSFNVREVIGRKVCTFKGKDITLNIINIDNNQNSNKTIILNIPIITYIYTCIIKTINYGYSRNFRKEKFTIL